MLAPYELLLRVEWQSYLHPFFLLAAFISAGAVAVSALFFFAALAGLASRITFDARKSVLTYTTAAPTIRPRTRTYPLASIEEIAVRTHEWSDGSPSYSLKLVLRGQDPIESAASWSLKEVEAGKAQIEAFLKRHAQGPEHTRQR